MLCMPVFLAVRWRRKTITYDNGKEFASHVEIATSLGALSYFAKPYHSWERGLNEHTNGLFRQYFPKGSDLSILSDTDVQRVEDKLNSRPRKILGYQTPRGFLQRQKSARCTSLLNGPTKILIPAIGFSIPVAGGCAAKPDRKRMAAGT